MRSGVALGVAFLVAGCGGPASTASPSGGAAAVPTSQPSIAVATTGPPASVDTHGCPTDPDAAQALLMTVDHRLVVGGSMLQSDGTTVVEAIYGGAGGADQIPPFASLDLAAAPIGAPAGGGMAVREAALTLVDLKASLYARTGFTDTGELVYRGPAPMPLDTVVTTGVARVTMPSDPGAYVLELWPGWESPCFRGSGVTWVVIQVS